VEALQRGDLTKAETILRAQPEDAEALGVLAVVLDRKHKYEEAESIYRRALSKSTRSAPLLNNYGNHPMVTGKLEGEAHARQLADLIVDSAGERPASLPGVLELRQSPEQLRLPRLSTGGLSQQTGYHRQPQCLDQQGCVRGPSNGLLARQRRTALYTASGARRAEHRSRFVEELHLQGTLQSSSPR